MCLYPRIMRNKKYTATKKNGGNVPKMKDDRTKWIPVPCQNCIECRKQKARDWQIRLGEEIRTKTNGRFITLTFSDESISKIFSEIVTNAVSQNRHIPEGYEMDNAIATYACRHFLERWRWKYKKSLRHWLVTEIGHKGTENIHMHGIIWTDESLDVVEKIWNYGFMWKGRMVRGKMVNYVNQKTVGYIGKYVYKKDEQHKTYRSIILCSPGIGKGYMERTDSRKNVYKGTNTITTYRTSTGHKIGMPTYYRNKIYSEDEREWLWIHEMNRERRFVLGMEIDTSKGGREYNDAILWAREINRELRYGTDSKDWDRELYERDKRIHLHKTRIAKAKQRQYETCK